MVYCILFAAAFMYFILDRKIQFSVIPGIAVTFITWCALVRYAYDTSLIRQMDFYSTNFSDQKKLLVVSYLAPTVLIICFALISSVALSVMGRNFGKLIFDKAKDNDKAKKTAKFLFIISSIACLASGILFLVINSLRFSDSDLSNSMIHSLARFYGIALRPENKMKFYIIVFSILIIFSIAFTVLGFVSKKLFKEILPADPELKATGKSKLFIPGIIFVCAGNICIGLTALINLRSWTVIIFYDGSKSGYLCTAGLILNLAGLIFLIIALYKKASDKQSKINIAVLLVSSVLMILTVADQFIATTDLIKFLAAFFSTIHFYSFDYPLLSRDFPGLLLGSSISLIVLLSAGSIVLFKILISASAKKEI